ncbi:MAG: serine hydrolase [Bacteroidales bacterium]
MGSKILFLIVFLSVRAIGSSQPSGEYIDSVLSIAHVTFDPAGISMLIVREGEVFYKNAAGFANLDKKEELSTQHLFNIASCTKAFTAACAGKLVSEQKLNWKDHIINYVPILRLSDPFITANLNIIDALSHRSGFKTFQGDLLWYHSTYNDSDVLARMKYLPVVKDFRGEYGYQNNMYLVAGKVIESISGQTWEGYIHENFFVPLRMKHSYTSETNSFNKEKIAYPHVNNKPIDIYFWNACKPAGAIYSSVEDMAAWLIMLLDSGKYNGNEIIPYSVIQDMFTPRTNLMVSPAQQKFGVHFRDYGLGWVMYDYNGVKVMEHGGGMPGYISKVAVIPELDLGMVILNNGNNFFADDAVFYTVLDNFIPGKLLNNNWMEFYLNRQERYYQYKKQRDEGRFEDRLKNTSPSLPLAGYTGLFNDKSYGQASVDLKNGKIFLTLLPAGDFFSGELKHWHLNTFSVQFNDPYLPFGLVTFDFDHSSKISGFKIDIPNDDFHFQDLYFNKIHQ